MPSTPRRLYSHVIQPVALAILAVLGGIIVASLGPLHPASAATLACLLILLMHRLLREREERADTRADFDARLADATDATRLAAATLHDLRAVIEASEAALLVVDPRGRVSFATPACSDLLGKPHDELPGRPVDAIFTHAAILEAHRTAVGGTPAETRVRHASGSGPSRTFLVRALPVPSLHVDPGTAETSRGTLILIRDVSDQALTSQWRSDFVTAAGHELRTPLASIRAAFDTLADGAWEESAMRDRLSEITRSNIERLESLLRDLLDLSRLDSGRLQIDAATLDVRRLIASMADDFGPLARARGVDLRAEVDAAPASLRTDRRLLELIVRNLVDNATKFAFKGTVVRIVCSTLAPAGGIRLRVIDQGIGIPLEHQPRIFERFYQADPARAGTPTGERTASRGTGLGLAIARESAHALGGDITVQSVWKQGTTMTVELPDLTHPDHDAAERSSAVVP
ncbi:MAG: ATP-binding protein [Phycisphaerae bacterium]|jgi:signal transduction histidine kinase